MPAASVNRIATLADFRPAATRSAESVVQLYDRNVEGQPQLALGTVVSRDGYIATKYSEVDEAGRLACRLSNGRVLDATIVSFDRANDIAILQIPTNNLRPIRWQSEKSKIGQLLVSANQRGKAVAVGVTVCCTHAICYTYRSLRFADVLATFSLRLALFRL